MDRATLTQKLIPFTELGKAEGRPFSVVRLDDAIPGIATGKFIVRLLAPWVGRDEQEDVYGILANLLWRSTEEETRRAIFALNARAFVEDIISEGQAQAVWNE